MCPTLVPEILVPVVIGTLNFTTLSVPPCRHIDEFVVPTSCPVENSDMDAWSLECFTHTTFQGDDTREDIVEKAALLCPKATSICQHRLRSSIKYLQLRFAIPETFCVYRHPLKYRNVLHY